MIGLGSYAFFWQHSDRVPQPLDLIGALERTRELDVDLFQICDYAPLLMMSSAELRDAALAARRLGIRIELGTKGVAPGHLMTFLRLAERFDADLVRSMVFAPGFRPTLDEAEHMLRQVMPAYEVEGVTLALETYEQVPTAELVGLIERVGSHRLGICLDPANVVAGLELPRDAVERCAPVTRSIHAKDFAFSRQEGWVGFTYSGAPMGEGLHDYPHLLAAVNPEARGVNEIVEHWLPWQGDPETTIQAENDWTTTALDYLRSIR
ncbi:TIM barrel protein [Agromyces sp. ISL-38]|uniref:sugar phosphate isomerase/epimerase family protein n=1 Tax=Agromyces sp. ISL-38 TaxID=2819107 RepID=UPI001BE962CF|nr:TIM barrel protein [Agromyces sp. ISL-38]MBT2500129.1 TIM barrel protein [Agromyces sp. ISL-38]MBT2516796.1 TIM barrel protein [Streptomyces sp. ISL-90]